MPRNGILIDADRLKSDKRLQRAGFLTAGIWLRCLLFMFTDGRRGSWTAKESEIMDALAVGTSEWARFKYDIKEFRFGNFVEQNGYITMTAPLEMVMEAPIGSLPDQDELSLGLLPKEEPLNEKRTKPPYKEIQKLYNEICSCAGLPKCTTIKNTRATHVKVLWGEHPDLAWFKELFTKMAMSSFLTGKKKTARGTFLANIDFAVNPSKTIRILEGVYDDRPGQNGSQNGNRRCSDIENEPGGKNYEY